MKIVKIMKLVNIVMMVGNYGMICIENPSEEGKLLHDNDDGL